MVNFTLGALPHHGGTRFRIPATSARQVTLVLHDGPASGTHALARAADRGPVFEAFVPGAHAGHRYSLVLEGGSPRPDPASRFQPEGVHGPSEIIDSAAFQWSDHEWRGCEPRDLVIYELHVGTFSPEGTFAGARARLPLLKELGITAIELMPVADFPGHRNWGYDGVCLYAPARAYGHPDDLRGLVNDAHRLGLAVLLDVVYNHLGPEGAYVTSFLPEYLTSAHATPWGCAVNLDGPGSGPVRQFIAANAAHWIGEYHLDGLRLDATHALIDESPVHIVHEIAAAARAAARWPIQIHAEDHRNLATVFADASAHGWGIDAVWADDFHHIVRRLIAGDQYGYYSDFRGVASELALTLRQGWLYTGQYSAHLRAHRGTDPSSIPKRRFVVCLQNHDQVGNRAHGDRLHHTIDLAAWRAGSVLLLTTPMTPLLFMGQEWAASTPFQFFTHLGGELAEAVTSGRRQEFSAFPEFAAETARTSIPDPQAESTLEASRLRWEERSLPPHAAALRLYRALLELRRGSDALCASDAETVDAVAAGEHSLVIRRSGSDGTFWMVVRLKGQGAIDVGAALPDASRHAGTWSIVLTSEDAPFAVDPQPPAIEWRASGPAIEFQRPAGVILKSTR